MPFNLDGTQLTLRDGTTGMVRQEHFTRENDGTLFVGFLRIERPGQPDLAGTIRGLTAVEDRIGDSDAERSRILADTLVRHSSDLTLADGFQLVCNVEDSGVFLHEVPG